MGRRDPVFASLPWATKKPESGLPIGPRLRTRPCRAQNQSYHMFYYSACQPIFREPHTFCVHLPWTRPPAKPAPAVRMAHITPAKTSRISHSVTVSVCSVYLFRSVSTRSGRPRLRFGREGFPQVQILENRNASAETLRQRPPSRDRLLHAGRSAILAFIGIQMPLNRRWR